MENMETVDQFKTKERVKNTRKRLRQYQKYSPFWKLLDKEFARKGANKTFAKVNEKIL